MNQAAEKTSFLSTYLKPLAAPLSDPAVVEIAINPDGKVWVETRGAEHMVGLEGVFYSPAQARDLATSIASATHGQISEKKPLVSGKIEMNGKPIRAQVVYPPVVDGGPSITLRRYSEDKLTLGDIGLLHGELVDLDTDPGGRHSSRHETLHRRAAEHHDQRRDVHGQNDFCSGASRAGDRDGTYRDHRRRIRALSSAAQSRDAQG